MPPEEKLSLFLRTIRERQDLADAVRYLPWMHLQPETIGSNFMPDELALVKEMAEELQMLGLQDMSFEEEFSSLLDHLANDLRMDIDYEQIATFRTLLYSILIASLPRIEILEVHTCLRDDIPSEFYHHLKRRLERAGRLVSSRCAGSSISSLHTIIVDSWRASAYAWAEEDTFGENSDIHLDLHEFLFSCASSLKRLVFRSCDAPYYWPVASRGAEPTTLWSRLPYLHTIVFDNMQWAVCGGLVEDLPWTSVEEQDAAYVRIEQIARECTSLRSFEMSVMPLEKRGMPNTFSPRRLVESLLPAASRLESLSIHPNDVRLRYATEVLLDGGMHRFTNLQRLSLNEECFCRHRVYERKDADCFPQEECDDPTNDEYPQVRTDGACLVNVLPRSVTSLRVRMQAKRQAIPDVMRLGRAAVDGQFPNLKRVAMQTAMPGLEHKLAEAFQGSSVFAQVVGYH